MQGYVTKEESLRYVSKEEIAEEFRIPVSVLLKKEQYEKSMKGEANALFKQR